jgi:hypothetical protein
VSRAGLVLFGMQRGSDGSYVVNDLPPGIYNLKIAATGFRSAEIHDVQIDWATVRRLPAVPLEIGGLIADCGTDRGHDYYSPSNGALNWLWVA